MLIILQIFLLIIGCLLGIAANIFLWWVVGKLIDSYTTPEGIAKRMKKQNDRRKEILNEYAKLIEGEK